MKWWDALGIHEAVLALFLLSMGVVLLFYGSTFFTYNIAVFAGSIFALIFYNFFSQYVDLPFVVYLVMGLAVGYCIGMFKDILMTQVGVMVGFVAGNVLFKMVYPLLPYDPVKVYYFVVGTCVITGAIIAILIDKILMVVATALFGSFCFIRVRRKLN